VGSKKQITIIEAAGMDFSSPPRFGSSPDLEPLDHNRSFRPTDLGVSRREQSVQASVCGSTGDGFAFDQSGTPANPPSSSMEGSTEVRPGPEQHGGNRWGQASAILTWNLLGSVQIKQQRRWYHRGSGPLQAGCITHTL
jgi:hypothetical protein